MYVAVDRYRDVELQGAATQLHSQYCRTKLAFYSQVLESILHLSGQNWHFQSQSFGFAQPPSTITFRKRAWECQS